MFCNSWGAKAVGSDTFPAKGMTLNTTLIAGLGLVAILTILVFVALLLRANATRRVRKSPIGDREGAELATLSTVVARAVVVVSPAYEDGEAKDEDRARWIEREGVACVCDGTTSSPYAGEAARHVVDFVERHADRWLVPAPTPYVFHQVMDELIGDLLGLRREAAERPIKSDADPALLALLEADVKEKRRFSHQTTIISARLAADGANLSIRYFKCGDSDLLVFDPDGKLLFTTADLRIDRSDEPTAERDGTIGQAAKRLRFHHPSNVTEVVPEKFLHSMLWVHEQRFLADASVLLATDGLLDAFPGPSELFDWLRVNHDNLATEEACAAPLAALHEQLQRRRGDDDISFVWVPSAQMLRSPRSQPAPEG